MNNVTEILFFHIPHDLGRYACGYRPGWYIFRHKGATTDYCPFADVYAWQYRCINADVAAFPQVDAAVFHGLICCFHSHVIILHVTYVAQKSHTICNEYIVFNGNSLRIAEVQPHLVANLHILTNLATQCSPDGGTQVLLVQEFKDVCLKSKIEDKSSPQRFQCEDN